MCVCLGGCGAPHKDISSKQALRFKLKKKKKEHFKITSVERCRCRQTLPFALYLSRSLSLHLPPADSAAENSDCTVVRHRAALTGRYNKASLFPRERGREVERHADRNKGVWGGGSFHLHHYLLKRHYWAKEKTTVGKQAGRPVSGITDLTCPSER